MNSVYQWTPQETYNHNVSENHFTRNLISNLSCIFDVKSVDDQKSQFKNGIYSMDYLFIQHFIKRSIHKQICSYALFRSLQAKQELSGLSFSVGDSSIFESERSRCNL